jgi:predicted acetyltransferase
VTVEFRRPAADEHLKFARTFLDLMNVAPTDEEVAEAQEHTEFDRSWIAEEDGTFVGTTTTHTYDVMLPGGVTTSLAGLTMVSVIPTHRRRGLMTELIARFFTDCKERGDALAALFATETAIYGRFGFGAATRFAPMKVSRDRSHGIDALAVPGAFRWGRVEGFRDELAALFERTRASRPGEIARNERYWTVMLRRAGRNADGKPVFAVVHDGPDGHADGYAIYRVEGKWTDHNPDYVAHVVELVGTGAVRVALWRFLLELDLVRTVSDYNARLDEPIGDVLLDSRQVRVTGVFDQLQLRVVDVERALGLRRYAVDDTVTLAVDDPVIPENTGTYRLEVKGGTAEVTRTDAPADVWTSARGLACAFLGDRAWRSLAESGLARFDDAGAAARADALFSVAPSPQCLTQF